MQPFALPSLRSLVIALATSAIAAGVQADQRSSSAAFDEHCAICHAQVQSPLGASAVTLDALQQMGAAQIRYALTEGRMRDHALDLSAAQIDEIVDYAAGASDDSALGIEGGAFCGNDRRDRIDLDVVLVDGLGFDASSTRFQPPSRTGLDAQNVHQLELKWAFGVPDVAAMRSTPVITADTVFLAGGNGKLYALEKVSGCIKWVYESASPFRTSIYLGHRPSTGERVLYVGDIDHVHAIDARTGTRLWRESVRVTPWAMLTGASVQHGSLLVVPVSSSEVALARNPRHECCRSSGAVVALDAETGARRWVTFTTGEAHPTHVSSAGTQQWGPSGAAVWATPTIDAARGLVYVGTGQNNSSPPTALSDAILALDLETGEIRWSFQGTEGDAYNTACPLRPPGPNCPPEYGPDFDFGASVIIAKTSEGREVLLAGQKSGDVYALDPDQNGKLIWNTRLSDGSLLGGVHWNMALEDGRLFVTINDPENHRYYSERGPRPGVYALAIDDGSVLWERRASRGCELDLARARGTPWPECSPFYGYSAAAAAVPGVVFAAGLDGRIVAHRSDDGELLWRTETARPFETVNGTPGHGGAIDNAGLVPAGRYLFVLSGYSLFGQMPGNVLLAYGLPGGDER
jgi:polyvinyl alcohol dehydrogenase (cytochrome)